MCWVHLVPDNSTICLDHLASLSFLPQPFPSFKRTLTARRPISSRSADAAFSVTRVSHSSPLCTCLCDRRVWCWLSRDNPNSLQPVGNSQISQSQSDLSPAPPDPPLDLKLSGPQPPSVYTVVDSGTFWDSCCQEPSFQSNHPVIGSPCSSDFSTTTLYLKTIGNWSLLSPLSYGGN